MGFDIIMKIVHLQDSPEEWITMATEEKTELLSSLAEDIRSSNLMEARFIAPNVEKMVESIETVDNSLDLMPEYVALKQNLDAVKSFSRHIVDMATLR